MQETQEVPVLSLGGEDPLEEEMSTHSSLLAWKIPWTEEPGRLQSMGSLRVRHNWATLLSFFTFMHWRRKWQPTPVFLPGESQGRGSLVGCRLWGCRVGHDWSDLAAAADHQGSPIASYFCLSFWHLKTTFLITLLFKFLSDNYIKNDYLGISFQVPRRVCKNMHACEEKLLTLSHMTKQYSCSLTS